MKPEQHTKANKIFKSIIKDFQYDNDASLRDFALEIEECISDVSKWKSGKKPLSVRVIVKLCRMFGTFPHDLNPDHFPEDLLFTFIKINKQSKKIRGLKHVK